MNLNNIRPDIRKALRDYADYGIPTGSFLRACLANDFMETVGRADDDNIRTLPEIACYIYNEIPANCHGSYEIVDAWIKRKLEEFSQNSHPDEFKEPNHAT